MSLRACGSTQDGARRSPVRERCHQNDSPLELQQQRQPAAQEHAVFLSELLLLFAQHARK